jgi:DNA polymerase I-like protein with 3'-5' exonuclease and polymerase domains
MRVYLSSADVVTPQALEILGKVKNDVLGDMALEFATLTENSALPPRATVFAMGKYARRGQERVVVCPSVGQIVTRADIVTRLTQAFKLLTDPPELPEFEYTVLRTKSILLENLRGIEGREVMADIETSGDVEFDLPEPSRTITISFTFGDMCYVIPEELCQDPEVYEAWDRFMERNFIMFVNGKFDLKYFPDSDANFAFDPQLAHYALYPAAGEHGLKQVTKKLFGFDDWDEETKKYRGTATYTEYEKFEDGSWHDARKYTIGSGFERIPRDILYKYAAYDVYASWLWANAMRDDLRYNEEAQKVFWKRMELSDLFMKAELKGFTIDLEYLTELKAILEAERITLCAQLDITAGTKLNPNSPKQVIEWFEAQGHPVPKLAAKSGPDKGKRKPSSGEEAMKIVMESGDYPEVCEDFAKTLLAIRGVTKNLGTYVNGFLDRAHGSQIHTVFNLTGPITGRLANRGAGIMTIPRDEKLRRMVIPSGPGRVLVKPDYGQLEMRIVAALSGDERFIAAFQPGMPDFFVTMLPDVFPDVDFSTWSPAEMKKSNYRTLVKPFSHGLNYGRGYQAIAKQLKMDPEEARRIASNYLGPEGEGLNAWQTEVKRKALEGEDIVTPYGFHLQSELVTKQNRNSVENSALSFLPQSMGNDICLAAALRIAPQLEPYDAWIVATIHDQIIADAPIEYAKLIGEMMEREMLQEGTNCFGDLLVMEAEPEYGFNWAEKMDPKAWDDWLTDNFVSQQSIDTRIKVSVG